MENLELLKQPQVLVHIVLGIAAFAEYERRLISQRTLEAMKAAKARGVHCGATSKVPQAIVERIVNERLEGSTWTHIAEDLDNDGIATAREASFWQIGSVQSVFRSSRGLAYQMLLKRGATCGVTM